MARQLTWTSGEKAWAGLVTTGVVGATLWPLVQYRRPKGQRVDGFPLSYYPMFTDHLGRYGRVLHAVGVRTDGTRFNLPYTALGPGGVNQVLKQILRAYKRGRADKHAQRIATRIVQSDRYQDVMRVEIVRAAFDFDGYMLAEQTDPVELEVLASADTSRPAHSPTATPELDAVKGGPE